MLVVDASALIEFLVDTPAGESVAAHLTGQEVAAPHIIDLEVLNALRRQALSGKLEPDRLDEVVIDLLDLRVDRYPHGILIPRIWFLRANFTPYDAAYLALAETLADDGVPLLTADARLARAARKHSDVEVLLAA